MSDEEKKKQQKKAITPQREYEKGRWPRDKVFEHIEKVEAPAEWPDPPKPDSSKEE